MSLIVTILARGPCLSRTAAIDDSCTVTDFPLPSKGVDAVKVLQKMTEPPKSLIQAMINHALSGAIHRLQPRKFQPHGMRHAMMVHIIRDLAGQSEVQRLVVDAKSEALALLNESGNHDQIVLMHFIDSERIASTRTEHTSLPPFAEIMSNALHVLQISEVRLLNSESDDELDYNDARRRIT